MKLTTTQWSLWHAVAMLTATVAGIFQSTPLYLIGMVAVSIAVLIVLQYSVWKKLHPVGGYANHVTFIRFVLLLVAIIMQNTLNPAVFVACIILVMTGDGLDGYLARKSGQATQFGEVFDMEVDAFLALSLAFLIWLGHPEYVWILAAGILRYIFVVVYRILGWQNRRRPAMPEVKVIAVIFFISLLVPFTLPWEVARWFVAVGCVAVAFSFLREFYLISKPSK